MRLVTTFIQNTESTDPDLSYLNRARFVLSVADGHGSDGVGILDAVIRNRHLFLSMTSGAEIDALQSGFERYLRAHGMTLADGGEVTLVQGGERRGFAISGRGDRLPVDVLQKYLDQACGEKSGWSLDYVHGDADAASLAQNGATAALLGAMDKRALFPAIAAGGVLPRKTFSMGEATEKRYYMECRAIEENNEKEMAAKE